MAQRAHRLVPLIASIFVAATSPPAPAQTPPGSAPATLPVDGLAARLGARASIEHASMSPSGDRIAWIAPTKGQGSAVLVAGIGTGEAPRAVIKASGDPERLRGCDWVSDRRLVCSMYAVVASGIELLPYTRVVAVDVDGGDLQVLSKKETSFTRGFNLYGGDVVDWLPDEDDAVLMTRNYLPDDRTGSRMGSTKQGLGVDRLDTRTLSSQQVEPPRPTAIEYLSDGRGTVRIMAQMDESTDGYYSGVVRYSYRRKGSETWEPFSKVDLRAGDGFMPIAIDPDLDLAYGWKEVDGRDALHTKKMDGSGEETLVFAHPAVDVDAVVRIGRRNRVVGASYATEIRNYKYFDLATDRALSAARRAIGGGKLLRVVDSSLDENRLLLWAGDDADPGRYYLLDRKKNEVRLLLDSRPDLKDVRLARMKPMTYTAADGTQVPGYLTLPPGKDSIAGLPALVLPHGGPSARDEWGFDWLSQFFALRGFAVLQPNFRGSSGYGDAWLQENGFKSWRIAIGDVIDAGRWLLSEGADPKRLGIFGWSYGGYAALQSAAVEPDLFKAVVAVAPVTDLPSLAEQTRSFANYRLTRDFIGTGPHLEEGSPSRQAARIRSPVLLFHGDLDRNVRSRQSRTMSESLQRAGRSVQLVTWKQLDHYLEDSEARTRLLAESDRFIQQAFGAVR